MTKESASTTRFGLIGTGRITRRLVADIQSTSGCEVTAVASRTMERAQWCASQYAIADAVQGYENLLSRDDVDAVYLSLPPSMHRQWCVAAAEAGKSILCEKPLGMNSAEVAQIDDACRQHGVRWLDATGWLHHPRTAAFADLIRDGRLGTVRHVSVAISFFEPFQSGEHRLQRELGGGCVLDLGWYACGVARFAFGKPCRDVMATAVYRGDVPIRCTAVLRFDDDRSATISCGYDTATRKWFEIAGSDASLICDDFSRPWPDKPARCWIHDASGKVDQLDFEGHQEIRMIETLIGEDDLASLHAQAIDTQAMVDAINRSLEFSSAQEPTSCI
ncbi:Gfo/Idh/MocA family protein [Crateriforma conspicua]|uniref:1,5-anhydro-D-fructose reductase n=1 Tax=Crateriforma conspicua TaxID=2527996 RepID=A0A5C6FW48_9PLAN|nr:Gfo/Idh/MocA family oxidoreductase [Crateriforma conspicua]TWU67247.1 1,5-anhydro-D-fructose reductase [Crateriforma conspicua]